MKPDWVAMCPEVEHLPSPCPVLMPGASVGCPRLGLGLRASRERTRQRDGHVLVDMGFAGGWGGEREGWKQLGQLWNQVGGLAWRSPR